MSCIILLILVHLNKASNLLNISKRRGKEEDKGAKPKKSKDWEKVSSEVLNIGGDEVGILGNVGYSNVSSLDHHFWCLSASSKGWAGNC